MKPTDMTITQVQERILADTGILYSNDKIRAVIRRKGLSEVVGRVHFIPLKNLKKLVEALETAKVGNPLMGKGQPKDYGFQKKSET